MVDYKNSKIYKITCSQTNRVYYGATVSKLYNRVRFYRNMKTEHITADFVKPKISWCKDIPCDTYKEQVSYLNDYRDMKEREALHSKAL